MQVEVSSAVIEQLLAEAEATYPQEACGILFGAGARVDAIERSTNVHPDPTRQFEIDPMALIKAHRAARAGGPQIIGYWHSHPLGPPQPSAIDRAHATGDGKVWAIVGEGKVGWWRDTPGGFAALSYLPRAS